MSKLGLSDHRSLGERQTLARVCSVCKCILNAAGRAEWLDHLAADHPRTHGYCGPCYLATCTTDRDYLQALVDISDDARKVLGPMKNVVAESVTLPSPTPGVALTIVHHGDAAIPIYGAGDSRPRYRLQPGESLRIVARKWWWPLSVLASWFGLSPSRWVRR